MKQPLITVVTVCYNAAVTIEKTMLSVINQTYGNIEYIIIDGGSTDGTADIIKKYADRIAYCVSEPDNGIYDAMNKGIKVATGEWINFMNAGDEFYDKDVIKKFIPLINDNTTIAYGDTMMIYSWGKMLRENLPIEAMTHSMVPGHQATLINTEYHRKHLYDISYKSSADFNFFHKAYLSKVLFQYIPIVIVNYEAEQGMSSVNFITVHKENARVLGIENTLKWRFSMTINIGIYYIKKIIKTILPNRTKVYIKRSKQNVLKYRTRNDAMIKK